MTTHIINPDLDADTGEATCIECGEHIDLLWVHGSEAVRLSELECQCSGPEGWHCEGEDAQHWAKTEDPKAECGYCGWIPDPDGLDLVRP